MLGFESIDLTTCACAGTVHFEIDDTLSCIEQGPMAASHDVITVYYEWNADEEIWTKLNPHDPDPDPTLEPGEFDGQLIEVAIN